MDAPVSSDDAAFSSDIAESALMASISEFLEVSQVVAPSEIAPTPSTVVLMSSSIPSTASKVSSRAIC